MNLISWSHQTGSTGSVQCFQADCTDRRQTNGYAVNLTDYGYNFSSDRRDHSSKITVTLLSQVDIFRTQMTCRNDGHSQAKLEWVLLCLIWGNPLYYYSLFTSIIFCSFWVQPPNSCNPQSKNKRHLMVNGAEANILSFSIFICRCGSMFQL